MECQLLNRICWLIAGIALILTLGVVDTTQAVPVFPSVITLENPGGIQFQAVRRGDEYVNWVVTLDGYTVVESMGVWYYAERDDFGQLISSGKLVGEPVAEGELALNLRPLALEPAPVRTPRKVVGGTGYALSLRRRSW